MSMKQSNSFFLLTLILCFVQHAYSTFTIVALDTLTREVGGAGGSCVNVSGRDDPGFLVELFPGVGAIATQASYKESNQKMARDRMNAGDTPEEIISYLQANSSNPNSGQYGSVGFVADSTQSAAHSGSSNIAYNGHINGVTYSIQGNILLNEDVIKDMENGFLNTEGDLAQKLMGALQGAKRSGADSRCDVYGVSTLFQFIKVTSPDNKFGAPRYVESVTINGYEGEEPIDLLQDKFDQTYESVSSSESTFSSSASSSSKSLLSSSVVSSSISSSEKFYSSLSFTSSNVISSSFSSSKALSSDELSSSADHLSYDPSSEVLSLSSSDEITFLTEAKVDALYLCRKIQCRVRLIDMLGRETVESFVEYGTPLDGVYIDRENMRWLIMKAKD